MLRNHLSQVEDLSDGEDRPLVRLLFTGTFDPAQVASALIRAARHSRTVGVSILPRV